jgi:hypothetical protein
VLFRFVIQPRSFARALSFNLTAVIICFALSISTVLAQPRRAVNIGGQRAIVVDERLAALRDSPDISAPLVQRLSRGRMVGILGARRTPDGLLFYRVAVTRRTRGWLQSESLIAPSRAGDDGRLHRLILGSEGFDRLARARIFLDAFPRSTLRPAVLMLYGNTAEEAATKLSRDAARRLDEREMIAGGAPLFSYYMNFNELDRYNKQGIAFIYDRAAKAFHYDGASWREIVRRHPRSPEVILARTRLASLEAASRR